MIIEFNELETFATGVIQIREEFERDTYSIVRFWGQTHIYLPRDIVEKVGHEQCDAIAQELFTAERLEEFGPHGWKCPDSYCFEFPSVRKYGEEIRRPDLADEFVSRIREYASR